MPVFSLKAAAADLAGLVARAEAGAEIILARGRKPVARIVRVSPIPVKPKRRFGRLKGKARIGPEFFEPLPKDELKLWEDASEAVSPTAKKPDDGEY